MNKKPFRFLIFAATAFATCLWIGGSPVYAQATKKVAPRIAMSPTAQVDGMADRVVDQLWRTTDIYWHHGDYNRIVSLIRVCVEVDPSFVEAYSSGAWLLWSMGDVAAAEALIQNGATRSPLKGLLEYEWGQLLYSYKKEYTAALPHLKAAVQNGDDSPQAASLLAHCYEKLGQNKEAAATWRAIIEKFPSYRAAVPNLRRVEGKLKSEQR